MPGTGHHEWSVLRPPIRIMGRPTGSRLRISATSTGSGGALPGPTQTGIALYSKARPRNPSGIGRLTGVGTTDTLAEYPCAVDTPGTPRIAQAAITDQRRSAYRMRGSVADLLHIVLERPHSEFARQEAPAAAPRPGSAPLIGAAPGETRDGRSSSRRGG